MSGGSWATATGVTVPGDAAPASPSSKPVAALDGVACTAPTSCLAVGSYSDGSGAGQGLQTLAATLSLPMITRLLPGRGAAAGGTVVDVIGDGVANATSVRFGSRRAAIVGIVSGREIEVESPRGTGSTPVTIVTPAGNSAITGAGRFTYEPAPTITRLSPNRGSPTHTTLVVIRGTGFLGVTEVQFGSTRVRLVALVSPTELKVLAPPGQGSSDVVVHAVGGASAKNAASHFDD
jgi:IPT/TIG domain